MKLSKTAWWILGIGFFILASAILVTLLSRQSGDAERLEDNLAVTENLLTKLISEREGLTSQFAQLGLQLDAAEAAYSQSQGKFPEEVASIEYDEELFSLATDSNLEVIRINAPEPRENEIDDITFYTTVFEVEVRGTVPNILTFIDDIAAGGYFDSATVELVNLDVPEIGQDEEPAAVIKIIMYSYEGE